MKKLFLLSCIGVSACYVSRPPQMAPVVELPATELWLRGTRAEAARLSNSQELEIVSNIVRGFFRPPGGQVRFIGLQPLANEHSAWADSVMIPDVDRAGALVRAIGLPRVCRQGGDDAGCAGNQSGGTLRFSYAYGIADDSAVIYAEYAPLRGGGKSEMEFRMARTPEGWHMAARRTVRPPAPHSDLARAIADELLVTDRGFGEAAANRNVVEALTAMFDDSVVMQIPGGFADGKQIAIASLRANPANEQSRITWAPIRVGVSGDGVHGFSFGYMTMMRPDSVRVPLKYLAYWINRDGQWRVLAYKRRPRPAGEVSMEMLPAALPAAAQPPQPTAYSLQAIGESLASAEKQFSDTAQVIGIGPAFARFGRPHDSMNMGGPTDTAFVIGSAAIGRSVGAGYPATGSPVYWSADYKRIVASSGDLGVTFGYIRPHHTPPAGQPPFFPFFTIWKRDPGGPWRYIAE